MILFRRWTNIFYGTMDETISPEDGVQSATVDSSITLDRGLFSWIYATFKIKDEHFLTKCGLDAVQYLSFQKNVILLVGIIMLISLGIVLPINYTGELEGPTFSFGHTTISNLQPQSHWLWVHITIGILYLPLSIVIMRRFSVKLRLEVIDSVSRTLMITDIPRRNCDVNDLSRHFGEAYPEYEVQNIQLAYDITKVSKLNQDRDAAHQAKIYCEEYFKNSGKRLTVQSFMCGYLFSCCGHLKIDSLDAINYYSIEENRLSIELEAAKAKSLRKPLGIAFVTMVSVDSAKRIYEDHKYDFKKCSSNPKSSSVSELLQPHLWTVKFAPPPQDIFCLQTFLQFAFIQQNEYNRWRCLFLPDKGAFFVNYVITSSLIGTGLELIRFPELFLYAIRVALSRSRAETISARKLVLWEFPFGVHYAWMLLIFALTVVYSLSCPLITVFGLLYMLTKHFVDRYNIYFAYGPSKIKQQIHATAINFVIASVVLLQTSFMFLTILRKGFQEIKIYTVIGFIITIAFAFAQCFLRWCESWGPIHYKRSRYQAGQSPRKRDMYSQYQYIPDVLRRSTFPHRETNNTSENNLVTLYTTPDSVETQIEVNSLVNNVNGKDTAVLYQNYNGERLQA
ncbi:hypothetical protein PGB90_006174 [Kerria lacca]